MRRLAAPRSYLLPSILLVETLPYASFLPFDPDSRWWLHLPLLSILTLPFVVALWRSPLLSLPYRLFLIWCGVTLIYTPYRTVAGGRYFAMLLLMGALLALVEDIRSTKDLQCVLGWLLRGCGLLIIANTIAWLHPGEFTWLTDEYGGGIPRFSGIFGQPNELGGLMIVTVSAGILHWRKCSWRKSLGALMTLSIAEAALADSRTSFVALSAGLCAWMAYHYRIKGAIVGAVLLLGLFTLRTSTNPYFTRNIEGFNGRQVMWEFSLQKIIQHPITGYGFEAESSILTDKHFPNWDIGYEGAHVSLSNGYLSLAVSVGALAALVWLFLFFRPWLAVLTDRHHKQLMASAFCLVVIPTLVVNLSESELFDLKGILSVIVFLFWALAEKRRLRERNKAAQRFRTTSATLIGLRYQNLLV